MRILWFNWRDIKNPDAGGAEVFTHEVMRRLIRKGYTLTLFTAEYKDCLSSEKVDGIEIVRNGGKYSVYRRARDYYTRHKNDYDFIIDEINTRPFLTPKFVKNKPMLAIFHQMAREFWFYETTFPLNYIGYYYLEKKWLSYYRDIPTITVSNSSRKDLEELGFKNIFIVSEGLNISPLPALPEKEAEPTILFIGRLKKAKLPHHALQAFSQIKKQIPNAKMWIVGDGYMRDSLKNMNIEDVTFYGRVSNEMKYEIMKRAHIALVPAVREGWGLVVTESNAMGTPTVAYDVHGIRDSVKDGQTGILVSNTPERMADSTIALLRDKSRLVQLSENALNYSRSFSWDKTAEEFDRMINIFAH